MPQGSPSGSSIARSAICTHNEMSQRKDKYIDIAHHRHLKIGGKGVDGVPSCFFLCARRVDCRQPACRLSTVAVASRVVSTMPFDALAYGSKSRACDAPRAARKRRRRKHAVGGEGRHGDKPTTSRQQTMVFVRACVGLEGGECLAPQLRAHGDDLQHVEAHSLRQRPALADHHLVPLLAAEARRQVNRHVLVALLKTAAAMLKASSKNIMSEVCAKRAAAFQKNAAARRTAGTSGYSAGSRGG